MVISDGVDGCVGVVDQNNVSTRSPFRLVLVVMVVVVTVLEGVVTLVGLLPWITSLFL